MKNIIIQTSDGIDSSPHFQMLGMSEPIVRKYADIFGYDYYRWDGIKVNPDGKKWLAVYNKPFLFNEIYKKGGYDWIIFMDADSFITTHNVDFLKSILEENTDKAVISSMVDIEQGWWCIDANVIIINTKHEIGQYLIENWVERTLEMYPWHDPMFNLLNPGDDVAHHTVKLHNEIMPFHSILLESISESLQCISYMDRRLNTSARALILANYIHHYGRSDIAYPIVERKEIMENDILKYKRSGDLII